MKMTQKVLAFARQTVNSLQRDRIIGCKFFKAPLYFEFPHWSCIPETIYLETIYLDKECRLRTLRVNESLNTLNISGIFGNQGGIADLFVPF